MDLFLVAKLLLIMVYIYVRQLDKLPINFKLKFFTLLFCLDFVKLFRCYFIKNIVINAILFFLKKNTEGAFRIGPFLMKIKEGGGNIGVNIKVF